MGIRAVFINAKEQREVAAGETVFAEGDTGAEMYGLISGAVELRKGEQSLGVLEPGDTFGELAIVSLAASMGPPGSAREIASPATKGPRTILVHSSSVNVSSTDNQPAGEYLRRRMPSVTVSTPDSSSIAYRLSSPE
jgi:CRP-like cAMP-binding protein